MKDTVPTLTKVSYGTRKEETKNRWCIRFISSFSHSPNTIRVIGQKEVNIMQSLVLTGAGRPRRYQQGHGYRRRYRQGRGRKLQKFKGFLRKAASFGKQHILPHLQEIGTNTLLDIMEGKNVRNSLRSNFNNTRTNLMKQQRRRRMHRRLQNA